MHLRRTTIKDIPEVADIAFAGFIDDPRVAYLNPHRHEYPEHFRAQLVRKLKGRLIQKQIWGFVCVSDKGDTSIAGETVSGEEKVLGYAWWERCNSSDPNLALSGEDHPKSNMNSSAAFERMLLSAEDRYSLFFGMNKAMDAKRQLLFRNGSVLRGPSVTLPPHWFLAGISVHAAWQRKGIGQQLLQWGLIQARKENMPILLSSSPEGLGMYKKNGFRLVDALGLPDGLPAEPYLIWDPTERWIRKIEASDASERFGVPVEVAWASDLKQVQLEN